MPATVLARHDVDLEIVQQHVARTVRNLGEVETGGHGGTMMTPRAIVVHRLAQIEAERLGAPAANAGHYLLALLSEGKSLAVHVLTALNVDLTQLRSDVLGAMLVPSDVRDRYIREREAYLQTHVESLHVGPDLAKFGMPAF